MGPETYHKSHDIMPYGAIVRYSIRDSQSPVVLYELEERIENMPG